MKMNQIAKCVSCHKYDKILKIYVVESLSLNMEKNIINCIVEYLPICETHIIPLHSSTPAHMICDKCMQRYHDMICLFDTNIMNCPAYGCNRQIFI